MTTILADAKLGLMVSDSNVSDGITVSCMRKVFRVNGALVGMAGAVSEFEAFLGWYRAGMPSPAPQISSVSALILSKHGLVHFAARSPTRSQSGIEAVGTGAMAALAAYEALGHQDPAKAVRIVCRHDNGSRGPVRTYKLTRP